MFLFTDFEVFLDVPLDVWHGGIHPHRFLHATFQVDEASQILLTTRTIRFPENVSQFSPNFFLHNHFVMAYCFHFKTMKTVQIVLNIFFAWHSGLVAMQYKNQDIADVVVSWPFKGI